MLTNDWNEILKGEFSKAYFINVMDFLQNEYLSKTVYPKKSEIFNALNLTSYTDTKVVILGQDPYINEGQAHGFAFSVKETDKLPPSLKNIYKEISSELHIEMSGSGNLENWAKQGILLLNTVLTVESGKSSSHKSIGWQQFTDAIIKELSKKSTPIVFVLWGNDAIKKQSLIGKNHLILTSSHPSPLSARHSFFGSNHFIKINDFLKQNNNQEIDFKV